MTVAPSPLPSGCCFTDAANKARSLVGLEDTTALRTRRRMYTATAAAAQTSAAAPSTPPVMPPTDEGANTEAAVPAALPSSS